VPESRMTPIEMFNELVRQGYIVQGTVDPSRLREPTAYISVPTALASVFPPIQPAQVSTKQERTSNAELGSDNKGNRKRKTRSRR
jgi:hypothetical protein